MGRLHVAQAVVALGMLTLHFGLYQLVGPAWTAVSGGVSLVLFGVLIVVVSP